MSSPDSCNWPSAVWQRWAADLATELGTPVTWDPRGFTVRGLTVATPDAVRAIAGRRSWTRA